VALFYCKSIPFMFEKTKRRNRLAQAKSLVFFGDYNRVLEHHDVSLHQQGQIDTTFCITKAKYFRNVYLTLQSISRTGTSINYEVIVSKGLNKFSAREIARYFCGVRFADMGSLFDITKAAKSNWIVIMEEGCTVGDGFLERLVNSTASGDIGLIEPKIKFANTSFEYEPLWEAGSIVYQTGDIRSYSHLDNAAKREHCYQKEVDSIAPYCYVLDKGILQKVEGLDTGFDPCRGFADLSIKMRLLGYKTIYNPLLCITSQAAPAQILAELRASSTSEQRMRFIEQWDKVLLKDYASNESEAYICSNRSKGKKCVLVIDDQLPLFDTNAGGRMMSQMLEVFVALDMNVKFVGANHLLIQAYADSLEEKGIELIGYDGGGDTEVDTYLEAHGSDIDYVLVSRPDNAKKYLPIITKHSAARIIYNLVDLHYLRMQRELELDPSRYPEGEIEQRRIDELAIIRAAHCSITPSTYEAELLNTVEGIERVTTVPIFFYRDTFEPCMDFDKRGDLLFVAGFQHSPNVDAMLWFCKYTLPLIVQQLPDLQLHIVGSHPPQEVLDLAGKHVIIKGQVSDDALDVLYESCRLAVIPLRYGAGVKGKLVEAMQKGLPVVSTSVGTEGLPRIADYITPTDEPEAFAQKVIELYGDPEQLASVSKRNRQYIAEHFSFERAKQVYSEVFELAVL
jgi:glycosyltransferase involved in cell wall biosynthesis